MSIEKRVTARYKEATLNSTAAVPPVVRTLQGQYQDKFSRIAKMAETLAEELTSEQKTIEGNLELDPLTLKVFNKQELDKLTQDMNLVANGASSLAKTLKSGRVFQR